MIPKIIHYCWFGGEKPEELKKYISTWKKMYGYKIVEWNEKNCDLSKNKYLKDAYNKKEWAFISDYIRLEVLYKYGGIYLDTDVEIKKKFKDEFLNSSMLISFMFNCNLSTAIIGAEPKNLIIKELLDLYVSKKVERVPNNDMFTKFFLEKFPDFKLNNKFQILEDNIIIYPKEYFECPSSSVDKGYSIHHFTGSWRKEKSAKKKIKKYIIRIMGVNIYQRIVRYRAISKSPFKERYYLDIK